MERADWSAGWSILKNVRRARRGWSEWGSSGRRVAPAGTIYHIMNRTAGKLVMLRRDKDFLAFQQVLTKAHEREPLPILAYCLDTRTDRKQPGIDSAVLLGLIIPLPSGVMRGREPAVDRPIGAWFSGS